VPQLPASNTNSSQGMNPSGYITNALTNQPGHGQRRKHLSSVAVRLLLTDGMRCSIVACAAIGTERTENTIPLLLFTGRCLVKADCCNSTILALNEYVAISNDSEMVVDVCTWTNAVNFTFMSMQN
jgi:hypothetical protein